MKKISLNYYGNDGKGCEYDVYENGEVTIYFMLNGIEISDLIRSSSASNEVSLLSTIAVCNFRSLK